MKHILVAFDFSKNAFHALDYAMLFANKMEADISLVWVDHTATPEHQFSIDHNLRIDTKTRLDEIIAEYSTKAHHGKINQILRKGKVCTEIASVAKSIHANLIFSGTHGTSGYEEYWVGSNAYRIVMTSPCPVVTIRNNFEFQDNIKKIVLPIDNSADTKLKLPYAAKIARYFDAEILILLLYTLPINVIRKRIRHYADETADFLEKEDIRHTLFEIDSDNMTTSLLEFTIEQHADLITIMTDQGTANGSMFLGPFSQQIINNASVPVLSVQSLANN
ncbi:MAG: universal stress protein [Bacteroidales bacterium]